MQKAMNHMHRNIVYLQDINREVMVGKRNSNCISCGVGPKTTSDGQRFNTSMPHGSRAASETIGNYESINHVQGYDGRLYIAGPDSSQQ